MGDEPKRAVGRYALWVLRSVLMVAVASIFIAALISEPPDNWIAEAIVATIPAMILYVEIWAWWHRLKR